MALAWKMTATASGLRNRLMLHVPVRLTLHSLTLHSLTLHSLTGMIGACHRQGEMSVQMTVR